MNNPPYLILYNNRFSFSPTASPPFLAAKYSYSLSLRCPASLHLVTHNKQSRKAILPAEDKVCKNIVCGLEGSGHTTQVRYGKHAKRHRKPARSGHRNVWRKMKTHKEEEKKERLLKLGPSQPPSEACVFRLLDEQPFRLHNSTPTFQCISQEWDMPTEEAPRLPRKDFLASTNGSSQISYSGGNADLKPDFSTRLLKILSGFKKEGELNDVMSIGNVELQFVKDQFQEVHMNRSPQSEVFTSSQIQNRLVIDEEKQAKLSGEVSDCRKELGPNKNELGIYPQSDLSEEDILDSPWIKDDSQFDHLFLEETDFSSESSDEDCQNEESMEKIYKDETGSFDCSNKPFEVQRTFQSESPSPPYSTRQSLFSPRHLSRSSGSRSSPSRSSIPGLRSKYSKPDPKAKQLEKHGKPLCLLPKFEVMNEGSEKTSFNGDGITSNGLSNVLESGETVLEIDWWESDDDDAVENDSSDGVKVFNGLEMGVPLKLPLDSDEDIDLRTKSLSKLGNCGISNAFENPSKQTVKQSEECIDFEWSDSEEELDMRAEDSQLFEWSDSDEDHARNKESTLRQSVLHTRDGNWKENGVLSADTQQSVSSQNYHRSTWSRKKQSAKSSSFLPRTLTWYNREECEKFGSITHVDSKPLHQLPATVKFLEVPPWKSQKLSHLPFEFQYSYSEIPKSPILGFRDHYSPFGPKTMGRPWTGRPLTKPRRFLKDIRSFDPVAQRIRSFEFTFNRKGVPPRRVRSREEVLGRPLTDGEVKRLVQNCHVEKRQVNLGRDGLTHNMLHLIHTHWKKRPVCRIKCRGPPTLDMDNVCFHVEDKTGGKIIYRTGCVLYVFRGRHYSYRHRPILPLMLYRPSSPVYPKLVPQAPAGLTIEEARELRILGQKVKPLIKLQRNGAFSDLVRLVRDAFMVDDLVSLDYDDYLRAGDYRKIGAKLRELVPCVLLSFRNHRIVLWKGKDSNPSLPHICRSRVEETRLVTESSPDLFDAEGSFINSSELKSADISNEALTGKATDVSILNVENTLMLYQGPEEENIQLQCRCNDDLTESSVFEQHIQTEIEAQGAARHLMVQKDVLEARSMCGELDGIWDTALKDGIAVELEGVNLEADLVLQVVSVFSEVAPSGPEYTNNLINKLRLQGVYKKSPKPFGIRFPQRRETVPRRKRLQKRFARPSQIKRRPDVGYPVEALARILHQK